MANDLPSTVPLSNTGPIMHNISKENIDGARREVMAILNLECITSHDVLRAHSSTPWSPAPPSQSPDLVITPHTTAEVSEIMKICSRRKIPVTAFSGGTSFPGSLTATRKGICIDFKNMDKILALHGKDLDVVVQPAVGWQDLNSYLEPHGFFFPPDPGPGARIGGMISMRCSGTNAYRHGTMKDWVVSMTVVLADGTIVKTRQRPRKSSAGYDLASLIVGSEGTLGLVTEAVLRITSLPQNQHVGIASFGTTRAAVDTAIALITKGLQVDALELLDSDSLSAINHSGLSSRQWEEKPTLFLRFSGSMQAVQEQVRMTEEVAIANGCEIFKASGNRAEIDITWRARKQVAPALASLKKDSSDLFLHADAAVPISTLADMIDWTNQIREDAGFAGSSMGHVGDGNFHASIVCPKSEEEKAKEIITDIQRRAIQLEGTITGEHGIGLDLRDMLVDELGNTTVDMMRAIKLAVDPQCLLNPDKVFRLESGV